MKKIISCIFAAAALTSAITLSACSGPVSGDGTELNENNLSTLVGKTVGVAQLANVPGLTLQVVLNKYNIEYQIIDSLQAEKAADKVNLLAVEASDISPAYGCDYYLCPEPAATAKVNGTKDNPVSLVMAGDLQELYGGNDGYPQAVLVAKKAIAGDTVTGELVSYLEGNATYLASAQTADILSLLASVRTEGLEPAFDANTLTAQVIANCSVNYKPASNCKTTVNAFLEELTRVNATAASSVTDEFFYTGSFTDNAQEGKRSVFVPDGAPALALVKAIAEGGANFDYNVIDSTLITAKVTGESPEADYCILPLNAASKLLGSASKYQMLGTVTNGNLYFLTVKNS